LKNTYETCMNWFHHADILNISAVEPLLRSALQWRLRHTVIASLLHRISPVSRLECRLCIHLMCWFSLALRMCRWVNVVLYIVCAWFDPVVVDSYRKLHWTEREREQHSRSATQTFYICMYKATWQVSQVMGTAHGFYLDSTDYWYTHCIIHLLILVSCSEQS
jgi:hypothetical protein